MNLGFDGLRSGAVLVAAVLAVAGAASAWGDDGDAAAQGHDVMRRVHEQARIHPYQRARLTLDIRDRRDRSRKRWLEVRSRREGDNTRALIRLQEPRNLRGVGLLSAARDGDVRPQQWLYLPAFRRVRKLSGSDQDQSFLGSDLTRRDLGGRDLDADGHRLMSQTDDSWVVESTPVDESDSYSRLVVTVAKGSLVPESIVFYDRKGELLKTLENTSIEQIEGMYLPTETLVTNHQSGGKTTLWRTDVDLLSEVSSGDVSLQQLDPR